MQQTTHDSHCNLEVCGVTHQLVGSKHFHCRVNLAFSAVVVRKSGVCECNVDFNSHRSTVFNIKKIRDDDAEHAKCTPHRYTQ